MLQVLLSKMLDICIGKDLATLLNSYIYSQKLSVDKTSVNWYQWAEDPDRSRDYILRHDVSSCARLNESNAHSADSEILDNYHSNRLNFSPESSNFGSATKRLKLDSSGQDRLI